MPHHIPIYLHNKYIVSCFSDDTIDILHNILKRFINLDKAKLSYRTCNGEIIMYECNSYATNLLISAIEPFPICFTIDGDDCCGADGNVGRGHVECGHDGDALNISNDDDPLNISNDDDPLNISNDDDP